MFALEVCGATKRYGNKDAIHDVSFSVNQGEILGYLGPNGSGKTTTLKAIAGLLALDSGSIAVLGENVSTCYEKVYGRVGVLFDENGLYERLTGEENIYFFLNACGKASYISDAISLLDKMELSGALADRVVTYSKGMKRKLALARCLSICPQLLLLDEPFDGIDIVSREKIIHIIKHYNRERGVTVVMTSHVMADIEDLASHMVVLHSGKVLVNENIKSFSQRDGETMTKKYLGVIGEHGQSMG